MKKSSFSGIEDENYGLFLSFEGISDTIYDSQVAMHVRQMRDFKINFLIFTFETWPNNYKKSLQKKIAAEKLAGTKIFLFKGCFIYLPFSELINSILFLFYFSKLKRKPDFIHARTEYSVCIAILTSLLYGTSIIWDCRGHSYAELIEAFNKMSLFKKMYFYHYLFRIKFQILCSKIFCKKAIFVSKNLKDMIVGNSFSKPYIVVPTTASGIFFYFDIGNRIEFRDKLGISEESIVLLYSGGIVGYQGFQNYVNLFSQLSKYNNYKFLIVTPHVSKVYEYLKNINIENYIVLNLPYSQMNAIYSAADYGVLIRDKNDVNAVASPTKFSEYCLSGLPVIMNDSINQSYNYASKIGNLINLHTLKLETHLIQISFSERHSISSKSRSLLSRDLFYSKYQSLYKN